MVKETKPPKFWGMKQRHGPLEGWKDKEHFCIGNLGLECVRSGGLDENDPQ